MFTAWWNVVKVLHIFIHNQKRKRKKRQEKTNKKKHVSILQIFKKSKPFSIGISKYIPSKIVWQISTVEKKCYTNDKRFEAKSLQ